MIDRAGLAISRAFQRTAPDPFVIAILLSVLTAVLAVTLGRYDAAPGADSIATRAVALLDAWRADTGLWKFLAFGMQMCLILVTGHALASSRPVRAIIDRLADLPRTTASAAALVGFVACLSGLLNWGLGLIVGAFLARDVGRALARRGVKAHYPLLCAAGYMALLVWHGGLSGSAPLSMTTITGAAKVLPAGQIEVLRTRNLEQGRAADTGIPLSETIGSRMNVLVTAGLVVGAPLLLMALAPRREEDLRPIGDFDVPAAAGETPPAPPAGLPDRLETSVVVTWLLVLPLAALLLRYVWVSGVGRLDLNTVNAMMLALGLVCHGSPRAYMDAVTDGARGCAGIIVQFPLYAGIMALMTEAHLVEMIAEGFVRIGNQTTVPLFSFASAGVVNLFVPSGGGQWGIQGPIALQTGLDAGIPPGRMIMAVAYGDQLTNMLQPFWALPLLGITGVRARDIVGYTCIVMAAAGVWMAMGLMLL